MQKNGLIRWKNKQRESSVIRIQNCDQQQRRWVPHQNDKLRRAPNTNERHSPIPLLDTDHPQKEGRNSIKNQGNTDGFRNFNASANSVVGLLSEKTQKQQQKDPPKPNQDHSPISLVDTNDPEKAQRDSMENHANEAGSSNSDDDGKEDRRPNFGN